MWRISCHFPKQFCPPPRLPYLPPPHLTWPEKTPHTRRPAARLVRREVLLPRHVQLGKVFSGSNYLVGGCVCVFSDVHCVSFPLRVSLSTTLLVLWKPPWPKLLASDTHDWGCEQFLRVNGQIKFTSPFVSLVHPKGVACLALSCGNTLPVVRWHHQNNNNNTS